MSFLAASEYFVLGFAECIRSGIQKKNTKAKGFIVFIPFYFIIPDYAKVQYSGVFMINLHRVALNI